MPYYTIILLLFCCTSVWAQDTAYTDRQLQEIFEKSAPEKDTFCIELPFEYKKQLIISATVNNETYRFLFDTGGYNMLNKDIVGNHKLMPFTKQLLNSSNGITKPSDIVTLPNFTLGGIPFKNTSVYTIDLSAPGKLNCMINGGVIGTSIIKKCVWQIDYTRKTIIMTNTLSNINLGKEAIRVPVHFNVYNQPYVLMRINGKQEMIMFDTGCSYPLWLSSRDVASILDTKHLETTITGANIETHNGSTQTDLSVMSADAELSGLSFRQTPIYYQASDNYQSLLGNPLIKDYIITLNFADRELYLEPIHKGHENGWKSYGITLAFKDNGYVVESTVQGSAAEKAGLLPGTPIERINGKKACSDYCSCNDYFNNLLSGEKPIAITLKNGKKVTLSKEFIFAP
jgi:hypothetical protein